MAPTTFYVPDICWMTSIYYVTLHCNPIMQPLAFLLSYKAEDIDVFGLFYALNKSIHLWNVSFIHLWNVSIAARILMNVNHQRKWQLLSKCSRMVHLLKTKAYGNESIRQRQIYFFNKSSYWEFLIRARKETVVYDPELMAFEICFQ